jgi:nucleoside-diphosphate-sugar epimerase
MKLLVIGGTGTLGRQIVKKALENGFQVLCLVRNQTKANFLKELGAQLVYGDLNILGSLPLAFKKVTAVIDASTTRPDDLTSLDNIDVKGKLALIKLAKIAGVKRFIFFSILNAEKYRSIPLMQAKIKIEEYLKESNMPYTIFKIAGFYQALISQYAIPILDKQPIWITKESVNISYIDTQDAASICLKSLLIKDTENQTFFLGTPKAWRSKDIIEICEKLSGQKAQLKMIPISLLKLTEQISSLFEWSLKINERLAFVKTLEENNFSSDLLNLYEKIDIEKNSLVKLENYLQEYFERILSTLKDLNYEDSFKQRDLKL